ncbi:hypothetical protein WICPIJ_007654 [Wickerhamomyces pijperi]|uniref:Uncharacterized protein n=1 Tax=Wickerhamomyces pijperi TaxID=599730 RepID=A0A9P8Q1A7_WICPI|nr:hypothetical protein WICPIJ_007654 [Wickerhamomyces pijperi]
MVVVLPVPGGPCNTVMELFNTCSMATFCELFMFSDDNCNLLLKYNCLIGVFPRSMLMKLLLSNLAMANKILEIGTEQGVILRFPEPYGNCMTSFHLNNSKRMSYSVAILDLLFLVTGAISRMKAAQTCSLSPSLVMNIPWLIENGDFPKDLKFSGIKRWMSSSLGTVILNTERSLVQSG